MFFLTVSVLADQDLLKSVLECSALMVSCWKVEHPLDIEDNITIRLSSEDEAVGLDAAPRVARHSFSELAPTEVPAPLEPHLRDDEVVVKKRALKQVKQVSALLHGEDLPKGTQAREVPEVLYQIPAVPREAKDCVVCQQSFKTHHRLMVHMGVHCGEKYPCGKCGKVLANSKMWRTHTESCVQGKKIACPDCGKEYASTEGMRQHRKAKHGADAPEAGEGFVSFLWEGIQNQKELS